MTCPIDLAAEAKKAPHAASMAAQRAIIEAAGGNGAFVPQSLWQALRLAYLDEEVACREREVAAWRESEASVKRERAA